jgi:ABC-type Zn uptake system ZnuABC Zn-binding protein ZnuA
MNITKLITLPVFLAACAACATAAPGVPAASPLKIVATTPELADITRNIGGKLVSVDNIARGPEDIHQVVMRPSFVTKLNKADGVIYLGMTVEHAFLNGLLSAAANPKMRPDDVKECIGDGCVDCSEGLAVLGKPANLSRSEGEQHPQGNPHYNVGPAEGVIMAKNIAKGLARLDPAHKADYEANLKAYLGVLEPALAKLRKEAAPLKGVKAVSVHEDVAYLGRFLGMDFVDTLEPKPGIAPTPAHLEELVRLMKEQNINLIVREQQYDAKSCDWLAQKTGAKVAVIGTMSNALPGTETFIKFAQKNVHAILDAVAPAKK